MPTFSIAYTRTISGYVDVKAETAELAARMVEDQTPESLDAFEEDSVVNIESMTEVDTGRDVPSEEYADSRFRRAEAVPGGIGRGIGTGVGAGRCCPAC